jgi:streptomycin 6-kinase
MNTFHSNIISIYGEKGKAWLEALPQLVAAISSKLDLHDLIEVTNLTYNYVLSGFQGDNPTRLGEASGVARVILKSGLDHEALTREAFVLKCFAGHGAVNVLAQDKGMLLLERAVPGTSLKSYFPNQEHESIIHYYHSSLCS